LEERENRTFKKRRVKRRKLPEKTTKTEESTVPLQSKTFLKLKITHRSEENKSSRNKQMTA